MYNIQCRHDQDNQYIYFFYYFFYMLCLRVQLKHTNYRISFKSLTLSEYELVLLLMDLDGDLGGLGTLHVQGVSITGRALPGGEGAGQLGQGVPTWRLVHESPFILF